MERYIKALVVRPGRAPEPVTVENELKALQELVEGDIETVTIWWPEPAVIVCNDEGLVRGLPLCAAVEGVPIYGTFLIVGADGEDFCSLTAGQMSRLMRQWLRWV